MRQFLIIERVFDDHSIDKENFDDLYIRNQNSSINDKFQKIQYENLGQSVSELDQFLKELKRQFEIAKEQSAQI